MVKKIIAIIVFQFFCTIVFSQNIEQLEKSCESGKAYSCVSLAEKRGLLSLAIRLLTDLAKAGDAQAQDRLGSMYGAALERSEAEFWCEKAKEQGPTKCVDVINKRRQIAEQISIDALKNTSLYVSPSQLSLGMSMVEVENLMSGKRKEISKTRTMQISIEDWFFRKERLLLRFDDKEKLIAVIELGR